MLTPFEMVALTNHGPFSLILFQDEFHLHSNFWIIRKFVGETFPFLGLEGLYAAICPPN
jgi:hypothetical protein